MLVSGLCGSSNLQGEHLLIPLLEVWRVFQQKNDGWMDGWMDLLVGTGVATALDFIQ